jgi:hypothetical protein
MSATVELILAGVRAGIKLARTGKKMYVEDTREQEITLPLPATFESQEINIKEYVGELEQDQPKEYNIKYRELWQKWKNSTGKAKRNAWEKIKDQYILDASRGQVSDYKEESQHVDEDVVALTTVRQWGEGDEPHPHPLHRAGGAIVEVAVDYFTQGPGRIDENTRYGRTLRAFLEGLDSFDFQEKRWDSILIKLLTSGLDAVDAHPELLAEDEETRSMISGVVSGVSEEVQNQLKDLPETGDLEAEERIARVGETVLGSVLRHSGEVALNHPDLLGAPDTPEQSVARKMGQTFLKLMLDDVGKQGTDDLAATLRRTFSSEGANRMLRSFLDAAAQHPGVFQVEDRDVEAWMTDVLRDLHDRYPAGKTLLQSGLFTDVLSLAVEHGRRDLPALLNVKDGEKRLLLEVAGHTLDVIHEPSENGGYGSWTFDLSREEVLELVQDVFRTLSEHPEWVLDKQTHQKLAADLLRLAVEVLTRLEEGRFKALLRRNLLKDVIVAALKSGLLEQIRKEHDPERVAEATSRIVSAVIRNGMRNSASLLDRNTLTDLLRAVVKSNVLPEVVEGTPDQKQKLTKALVTVIQALKQDQSDDVPGMSATLKNAV